MFDAIIVGGGVFGCSLGTVLARDGRRICLIERSWAEPDRIVGELLQPGGYNALKDMGIENCLDGTECQRCVGYVVHEPRINASVEIPYPTDGNGVGYGMHHGRLINGLRKLVKAENSITPIEGNALELVSKNGIVIGVEYKENESGEKKTVEAPLTIIADGCFSRFRKNLVKNKPTVGSYFAGTLMPDCPQAMEDHAELVLADPSPILIYKVSPKYTRILVDIQHKMPDDLKGHMLDHILPQLPEHLRVPFSRGVTEGNLRSMPNSWLPPDAIETPGCIIVGDAFNMRHPLTGGGMTVAFDDVVILRRLFNGIPDFGDRAAIMTMMRKFDYERKGSHSFVVNVLSMALYEIFAAGNSYYTDKVRRACFQYFKLGGECVSGPVDLLSALDPSPKKLLAHFFSVAFYAIYNVGKETPLYLPHRYVTDPMGILYTALRIIVPLTWSEIKTILF